MMIETAVVSLWGVQVGAVSRRDSMPYVQFVLRSGSGRDLPPQPK